MNFTFYERERKKQSVLAETRGPLSAELQVGRGPVVDQTVALVVALDARGFAALVAGKKVEENWGRVESTDTVINTRATFTYMYLQR